MSNKPETCPSCGSNDIRSCAKRNDWFCGGCDHCWQRDEAGEPNAEGTQQPKAKLFLSYGRWDAKDLADRLCVDLAAHGYEVWRDTGKIRAGEKWEQRIVDGLRSAQIVVALLSPHAVRVSRDPNNPTDSDSVCLDEISFARFARPRKLIVPVMAKPCEPPFCIFRLDYVDMQAWSDSKERYQAGLARLLEAVERGEVAYRSWDQQLKPWDFAAFLHEKRRDFCGRRWLFDEIDAWRVAHDERALLITGDPGTGKSAIVAQLVHENPGDQVLAYHCCQADTRATLEPWRFVRSLAAMIGSRLPEYAPQLEDSDVKEALSETSCQADPASALERGILAPLETLQAPDGGPRYLLIDALDEALALEDGRQTIVSLLATRIGRLPGWLRIVATTRKEPEVLDR
ncbi:MAG: toll/interleukin-1 receptor domain-containing protein, partial [Planctomycetes bacterium]|nr:toll/interleukin-1 receptor domain-containing protein [Planctomycetota bacterium]